MGTPDAQGGFVRLVVLSALAMSVGWGFRGNYGHEAGAMVPGALLGLSLCLASGRPDWWQRGTLLAFLGAIGWAFGGQMSYGRVIGYTAYTASYADVAYGYASLFVIGALWGGIGAGVLAMGLTMRRSDLERYAGPLVALWVVWLVLDFSGATNWLSNRWYFYDTDWVAAVSALLTAGVYGALRRESRPATGLFLLLAAAWIAGCGFLTGLLGLRMTPPRSDNWSGCVGLLVGLGAWHAWRRNRAALALMRYGLLAGGLGFACGDFVQMLGRAQWGPIGAVEWLQGLDYWKWMEQLFGLIMGAGVAWGAAQLLAQQLEPPEEDTSSRRLNLIALLFLLAVMMWENLHKNVVNWAKGQHVLDIFWGLSTTWWFLLVGLLLTTVAVVAAVRHYRRLLPAAPESPLGRAQGLFLLVLWISLVGDLLQAFPGLKGKATFFVELSFWLTAGVCSLVVVTIAPNRRRSVDIPSSAASDCWRPGRRLAILGALSVPLVLLLAWLTIAASSARPLPGSHPRFAGGPAALDGP